MSIERRMFDGTDLNCYCIPFNSDLRNVLFMSTICDVSDQFCTDIEGLVTENNLVINLIEFH